MKGILSLRAQRQLDLVELLMNNEFVTLTIASEQLNSPIKTIKTDIVELEMLLAPAKITFSKKEGICLKSPLNFCKSKIYQKFIQNSIEFQMIEKVFLKNFDKVEDLAEDLYISLSTVKRFAQRINQFLQIEGFTINLKKMQLIGDSHSICNFMKVYFYEKYGVAENFLSSVELTIIDQIIVQIIQKSCPSKKVSNLDFSLLNSLRFYTYSAINLLKNDSRNLFQITHNQKFELWKDTYFCDEFYSQFNLPLSLNNLHNISYLFFSDNYAESIDAIYRESERDRHMYLKYQKIKTLVHHIEKKAEGKSIDFDEIILRLYNLDSQIHGRTFVLYDKNKEFYNGIINLYGHFPERIIHSLQGIYYLSPHKEYLVYEAIFTILTQWPGLLECLERSKPTVKAALLFNSEMEYMDVLCERINYNLKGHLSCIPIEITSINELEKLVDKFDCIITNIPDIYIKDIPVVLVPSVPDAKSFAKMMLVYEHHFSEKQRN